jgi:hypothetical protein
MPKCVLHPGANSVLTLFGRNYCAACQRSLEAARRAIDRHVQPRDCFIWYKNSREGWSPIPGTGCAHWVAHEFNIRRGPTCLAGFSYRVRDVISGRRQVELAEVRVDDFYTTPSLDHIGVVVRVTPASQAGQPPVILIRHDSSQQGGLATDEFARRFHSQGNFYR